MHHLKEMTPNRHIIVPTPGAHKLGPACSEFVVTAVLCGRALDAPFEGGGGHEPAHCGVLRL